MKSLRRRHSRSLEGLNAQGFFSPQLAYTAEADIAAFSRNAAEGEIGLFDENNALITAALAPGDKFTVAQIVDSEIKRSTVLTYGPGALEIVKTPYDAPVIKQTSVGYSSASGSGDLNIAIVGGLQEFVLKANETTPANQPFPTQEARAVVRSTIGVTIYDIVNKLVSDFNNENDFEGNADVGFAFAEIEVDTAGAANGTADVINGSASIVSTAHGYTGGEVVTLAGKVYKVIQLIDANTYVVDKTYQGPSATGVAQATVTLTGTDLFGILITAKAEDITFTVGVSEDLASATISEVVAWKQGSGAAWQVAPMEKETQVFDGEGTQNYPFREDYGRPNKFVDEDSATEYDLWFLKYLANTDSMAYANERYEAFGYVILASPNAGANPGGNFDTILGT